MQVVHEPDEQKRQLVSILEQSEVHAVLLLAKLKPEMQAEQVVVVAQVAQYSMLHELAVQMLFARSYPSLQIEHVAKLSGQYMQLATVQVCWQKDPSQIKVYPVAHLVQVV